MRTKAILILISMVMATGAVIADEPKTLEIGASAPSFSLPGIDGKTYTLDDFANNKILVIIFTANHCPTAQAYEERIDKLYRDFNPEGVGFVLVSPNHPDAVCIEELGYSDLADSYEEMKIRAGEKKFPMPYLYDGDKQEMAHAYGPTTTPHVFIFDAQRKLRFCGRIDEMENPYVQAKEHDTRNAIMALLDDKPVPVEKTKTFGCSIKWAEKVEWRNKLDVDWKARPVEIIDADLSVIKEVLANNSSKYRLINVWATWCGPCIIEYPEFITMQRMYGARDFEFVSISTDGVKKKDKVLEFLKEKNSAVKNYLYTPENKYPLIEAVDKNWSGSLPYTLLVAPGGEVVWSNNGVINVLELRKEIMQKIGRFFADD